MSAREYIYLSAVCLILALCSLLFGAWLFDNAVIVSKEAVLYIPVVALICSAIMILLSAFSKD